MTSQSLKSGWKMVKFGDVVKNANLVVRDPEASGLDKVVGLEHIDPENLHIRRWNSVEDGTSFTRKFVPGQTLFGKRRAYQRKVAFAEFEGICSGDILTFESKNPQLLLPELLPFICQSDAFFDYALGTSAGSLSPRTSWTALKDFEFPLPPLDEQKRIAEILWAADEAKETISYTAKASETLLQTLIDNFWIDLSEKTENLPLAKLGSLTNGITKSADDFGHGVPFVNLNDIFGVNSISLTPPGLVNATDREINRYSLQKNDVLFVRSSVKPSGVGLTAVLERDLPETVFSGFVIRFRPRKGLFETSYLKHIFYAKSFRRRLLAFSTVSANTNINQKSLELLTIPVPDIYMQREFGSVIDAVENKIKMLREIAKEYSDLGRLISKEAFHV